MNSSNSSTSTSSIITGNNTNTTESTSCPCKYFISSLSSATAAEYGDLAALSRRIALSSSSSSSWSSWSSSNTHTANRRSSGVGSTKVRTSSSKILIGSVSTSSGITNGGITPLHLAAQHGHAMAVALLLDDGHVDVDTGLVMTTTTTTGGAGWKDDGGGQDTTGFSCSGSATPLHRASFSGAISAMQLLLTHGANLFTKDTSFGDGRTPLHKAVAGGRPLAVKLLLEALSNKSNNGSTRRRGDDNNEEGEEEEKDLLQLALEMKDAYGQTPIELAQHYCTQLTTDQIEYEKQSVRRWDVVAGGDRADWNACLRLLLEANAEEGGRTGQTMITTPFSWKNNLLNQQENTIENNQRGNGTLDNGTDRHNENTCQDDGRCCSANIISKWESEFRKAFLATTTNNTTSSSSLVEIPSLDIADVRTTMKLASDIATKDSDEEDHAKTSSSIQSPMQHDANDESDPLSSTNNNTINNALSNKSHFIVAGAPNIVMQNDASEIIGNNNTTTMMGWQCENCGIHTMALFRLSVASTSRLVCRNCRRRKT